MSIAISVKIKYVFVLLLFNEKWLSNANRSRYNVNLTLPYPSDLSDSYTNNKERDLKRTSFLDRGKNLFKSNDFDFDKKQLFEGRQDKDPLLEFRLRAETAEWEYFGVTGTDSNGLNVEGEFVGPSFNDRLGEAVAMSYDGSTIVISSADNIVTYDYDWITNEWNDGFTIELGNDGRSCGVAISEDGNRLAIAAPFNDELGSDMGMVEIYEKQNDNTWSQLGNSLSGDDPNDTFGYSVDLSSDGGVIVIGAVGNSFVSVYEYDGISWELILKPNIDPLTTGFGFAVAVSGRGTRILIGAPFAGNFLGLTYIVEYDPLGIEPTETEIKRGVAVGDEFGSSLTISMNGERVAIGTSSRRFGTGQDYVKTYAKDNTTTAFTYTELVPSLSGTSDAFGGSVSFSEHGQYLVVGAPRDGALDAGRVYVYETDITLANGRYTQFGESLAEDSVVSDNCGHSVTMASDGKRLAFGCPGAGTFMFEQGKVIVMSSTESDPPSLRPSLAPTTFPSIFPTQFPSQFPSVKPSNLPSVHPSIHPTLNPSIEPTASMVPSLDPTLNPSSSPSVQPTLRPSLVPSILPSLEPSIATVPPSLNPSDYPSIFPTLLPSTFPSQFPTMIPSTTPSLNPTDYPSIFPTLLPSVMPSEFPVALPSEFPSLIPTAVPSIFPSLSPSESPTLTPSNKPSASMIPSQQPTIFFSSEPTSTPSSVPTKSSNPSSIPSLTPSHSPSAHPTISMMPSLIPSQNPTLHPTISSQPSELNLPTIFMLLSQAFQLIGQGSAGIIGLLGLILSILVFLVGQAGVLVVQVSSQIIQLVGPIFGISVFLVILLNYFLGIIHFAWWHRFFQ